MALATKNTRFALVKETTEATPVLPSAAGDYLPIRAGLSVSGEFEQLENDSFTGSIGVAKSTVGLENPTASISCYLHGSGSAGTAPDIAQLLEGALGSQEIEGTEYDTVASSTTTVVNVDTAEGAQFVRGQSLLVKNSLGYEIRPVDSISGDALTLGFALGNAPGTGVNLGQAIVWSPSSSLPSWTLADYRGNGGVIQVQAGDKVESLSISASAGQFVEVSADLAGSKIYWNPIEITASTNALDFDDDAGAHSLTLTAKLYKDPYDAATALESALNAAGSDTFTVTYSSVTGKFTVASDGAVTLNLDWATTANTLGAAFGFTADDTGAFSYVSDSAYTLTSPQTPSYDSEKTLVAKDHIVYIGDSTDTSCFCLATLDISLSNTLAFEECMCEESGRGASQPTARSVEISCTAVLKAYEADLFRRLRTGSVTKFFYIGAVRESAGGNFVANKNITVYAPTCTVSALTVEDNNDLVFVNFTLKPYVESGLGEFFINQV